MLNSNFNFEGLKNVYFNRDNINATSGANGSNAQRKLTKLIKELKKRLPPHQAPKIHFRHVKAHTKKDDKRSYVNDWCDSECTKQLRNWKQQQINNPKK